MYVCMHEHVCMYVCICVCIRMYVCNCVSMYVCKNTMYSTLYMMRVRVDVNTPECVY